VSDLTFDSLFELLSQSLSLEVLKVSGKFSVEPKFRSSFQNLVNLRDLEWLELNKIDEFIPWIFSDPSHLPALQVIREPPHAIFMKNRLSERPNFSYRWGFFNFLEFDPKNDTHTKQSFAVNTKILQCAQNLESLEVPGNYLAPNLTQLEEFSFALGSYTGPLRTLKLFLPKSAGRDLDKICDEIGKGISFHMSRSLTNLDLGGDSQKFDFPGICRKLAEPGCTLRSLSLGGFVFVNNSLANSFFEALNQGLHLQELALVFCKVDETLGPP